jgi:hypothetical protein
MLVIREESFSLDATSETVYDSVSDIPDINEGGVYYIATGETVLGLSNNIGKDITVKYNGQILKYLDLKSFNKLSVDGVSGGTYGYYTRYWHGTLYSYKIYPRATNPPTGESLDISYFATVIPEDATTFDYGENLLLPAEWYQTVELGVEAKIFRDMLPLYHDRLNLLREYSNSTPLESIPGSPLGMGC